MPATNKYLRIFLADLVHDFLPGNYVLPLNIGLMSAYLKNNFGTAVDIRLFKSPEKLLDALKLGPAPHILGFSNYSWNQEINRSIGNKVRSRLPETVICAGGPHIRTDNAGIQAYLQENDIIDYYCMFEGEIPLGNIVERMLSIGVGNKKKVSEQLPGVAYLVDGELVYSPVETTSGKKIENIPSPYLTGVLDEFLMSDQWLPILESNRGCPFHCTFCVWGIAALDKVKQFPIERVLEEIKYVAKTSTAPRWIFADANFGILPRDLDIARQIRSVAEEFGCLKKVAFWWAKNASKRTTEIARIFGPLTIPSAAVQTLDDVVLRNIKRDNIKLSTMTDLLDEFHETKLGVATDVLVGQPGESYQSHLETLRKVFQMGFDDIVVGNIRLLPGSEMEDDQCRETYQLKTKYRLISGSYGKYDGDPVFDFEESVRSSRDITEEEMHSLRLVHFFIYPFWNLGMAKPLLQWLQSDYGRNPLDVILKVTQLGNDSELDKFIQEFDREAREEWFDSPEALRQYYSKNFDDLVDKGFLKLNFKFLAKFLLDKNFARILIHSIIQECNSKVAIELAQFCLDRIYFLDSSETSRTAYYSDEAISVLKKLFPSCVFKSNTIQFKIEDSVRRPIEFDLNRFCFDEDPLRALALTLETYRSQFLMGFESGASAITSVPHLAQSSSSVVT
jgi:radical SAM superfamily enzyme YgiQ (UPF0313 family)